ncbi:MAG: DUF4959 domain-containing protein [Tannerella sp.]|jgi:hypothetical protein|nr:DUF4959 domain-containing protein [Tannerella sp.]
MKRNIFMIWLSVLFFGCTEEKRPEIVMDSVPPAPVTDVQIKNIPGGAVLKYQLPDDEDLLYVKALYSLKEERQAEVKASLYCDTLVIKGFGDEQEREVQIVAVDRSKNESEPVKVTIKPLEPPVLAIGKTLSMSSDFGGVSLLWENPTRAEISVVLEKKDSIGDYSPVEIFYSSVIEGNGTARGMDTITSDFRAYVQDRWENQSAPLDAVLTPLFEKKFDRTKFQALYLDGDEPYAWGWVLPNMFDGNTGSGFHTETTNGTWPHSCSFDMGVKGKISRIKTWQRSGSYLYDQGNVRRFEVWGTNDVNNLNDWNAWTKLMDCVSIKPSGLPVGEVSDEDRAHTADGEEYICPLNAPAVRYLRLNVLESWSLARFFYIMEIEVYGSEEE